MPCKQSPRQPTPGPSGTGWSEELFRRSSQNKEPPIPGLSPPSKPPEDVLTGEPEPEGALTQFTEEPFAFPATPCSVIIIYDMPVGSPPSSPVPPPSTPSPDLPPIARKNPPASPPRYQAPLIPMMTLANNSLNCNQH
ncbi:hypothetical protein O181_037687 [Austropuccinia psidii MF-1]|uniref:Uncharacterized protein n=1 Tax=Austropuccinia psidii MF-1 TaxID=1389203 RepID=A0A9Q3DD90_9BASI|nr:hypothetical protein [Austropuccinia psidii MF-1]